MNTVRHIAVYAQEKADGLQSVIRANRSIALVGEPSLAAPFAVDVSHIERLSREGRARATNEGQPDLHYLACILVTAGWDMDPTRGVPYGWNANDDVFDPIEVWGARSTPEDKPANDEHDCAKVLGHITSNRPVLDDGTLLALEADDDLPGKYHLLTGAVLYKVWDKPELKEWADGVWAAIKANERKVSMECLFSGFDYAMVENGQARMVPRTKSTAYLTKHLRAYGGTGSYQGQRVGRLLRNITFSGVGVVKNAANPTSVILQATGGEKNALSQNMGYSPMTSNASTEHVPAMATDNADLIKQLAELRVENDRLKAEQAQANVKEMVALKDKAIADALELTKKLTETNALVEAKASELVAAKKAHDELKTQHGELEARYKVLDEQLSKASADKKRQERISKVLEALKLDEAAAAKMVDDLAVLSDDKFAEHVVAMTGWVTNNPQPGNTTFPAGTAAKPPQSTSAPTAPKSTSKPTVASELEDAEVEKGAALATETNEGADSLRLTIAAFLGRPVEDEK